MWFVLSTNAYKTSKLSYSIKETRDFFPKLMNRTKLTNWLVDSGGQKQVRYLLVEYPSALSWQFLFDCRQWPRTVGPDKRYSFTQPLYNVCAYFR